MLRDLSSRFRNLILALYAWVFFLSSCTLPPPPSCEAEYLIFKINDANATPVTTDTIDLPAGCIYTLTDVNNNTNGNNGLPAITSPIIINGNGSTIRRDPATQKQFRLFFVDFLIQADLSLNNLTLTGGHAYNPVLPDDLITNSGGAIHNGGHLSVIKSTIMENVGLQGAGIFNDDNGEMDLTDVTIDSNVNIEAFPGGGAGLYNWGTAVITSSTISHNGFNPLQPADGIYNSGNLEMTNSTVSRNAGCGIDNEGTVVLNHVTISFNDLAAICSNMGILYTSNTIFTSTCTNNTVHPTFPNLDMDGSCGGLQVPIDSLKLNPLADNGGTTQTNALRPGSVAIDMVVRLCLPTDQRGVPRPFGPKCDVGAFEYNGPPAPLVAGTETSTPTPPPQVCTFTAAVNVFCRSGPGASLYPDVDSFTAGQSAQVVGQSPDGVFVYVEGPNVSGVCTVPAAARFGTLNGDCGKLPVFTPPAPPEPTKAEEESNPPPSQPGCTVRQLTGALTCQVPCPPGAIPGDPCSP